MIADSSSGSHIAEVSACWQITPYIVYINSNKSEHKNYKSKLVSAIDLISKITGTLF